MEREKGSVTGSSAASVILSQGVPVKPDDDSELRKEILWARMPGFQPWPARYCSVFEELELKRMQAPIVHNKAILFFGHKQEKGWVPASGIGPFNKESWTEKFSAKRFKNDKDYRGAVLEAVNRAEAHGTKFDAETTALMDSVRGEFKMLSKDQCFKCRGSAYSGSFMDCAYCKDIKVHWFCFRFNDPKADSFGFICNSCCRMKNVKEGTYIQYWSEDDDDDDEGSNDSDRKKKAAAAAKQQADSAAKKSHKRRVPEPAPQTSSTSQITRSAVNGSGHKPSNKRSAFDMDSDGYAFALSNPTPTSSGSGVRLKDIIAQVAREGKPLEKAATEEDEEEGEDNCFVCGLDGELLLCDYPHCKKVYHRICLAKVIPFSLLNPEQSFDSNSTWFCPRHHCLGCGSLETLPGALSCKLPPALYSFAEQKANMKLSSRSVLQSIEQKALMQCDGCALAMCEDCQATVSPTQPLLHVHKGGLQCLNCIHPSSEQKTARLLEKAFVKMAGSRLALPFLRPFLPLYLPNNAPKTLNAANVMDLLSILEKIHSCGYKSSEELLIDMESMQASVDDILFAYLSPGGVTKEELHTLSEYKDVFLAYNTLIDSLQGTLSRDFSNQLSVKDEEPANKRTPARSSHRKRSRQEDSDSDDNDISGALTVIRKLWRMECHCHPWLQPSSSLFEWMNSGLASCTSIVVPARSLSSWLQFIRHGMNTNQKLLDDPRTTPLLHNAIAGVAANQRAKSVVNSLLLQSDEISDRASAARMMLGMQHTAIRETISLPAKGSNAEFGTYTNMTAHSDAHSDSDDELTYEEPIYSNHPREDETLLMIQRLEQVTQHALTLQAKLRADHIRKQRQISLSSSEVLTIGDAGIVAELKLSNDMLRRQLAMQSDVVQEQERLIGIYQEHMKVLGMPDPAAGGTGSNGQSRHGHG